MEGPVRLQLLGTVQVERDGQRVAGFRSRKALALLGYLATQGQPVPRERLVDLFWEDKPEAKGRTNLSWVLGRISWRTYLSSGCCCSVILSPARCPGRSPPRCEARRRSSIFSPPAC